MQKLEILWAEIQERLSGKKTYLVAALLVVTVLVLVFLGKMTPATAFTVALVFAGLLSATFRAAIEKHHDEEINLLVAISEAGGDVIHHNYYGAAQVAKAVAPVAVKLAAELKAEAAAAPVAGTEVKA